MRNSQFLVLLLVGLGSFTTVGLLYPGIVNITHVAARLCKNLIRLNALEYKSQSGCGVSKTLYKTHLIYVKIRYIEQANFRILVLVIHSI